MGHEILEVLAQFGGGWGGDPGNNAVRFLLAAFFWSVLAWVSIQQYRRTAERRDLYIHIAALVGLSRELTMFVLEYGAYRQIVTVIFSYRTFPPLEHALTDISRCILGFAYLRYFLPDRKVGKFVGWGGSAFFVLLYLVTAVAWPRYLDANPELFKQVTPRFGLFWGDMVFRVAASIVMVAVIAFLAYAKREGKRVSAYFIVAFLFLFLDEFLMIFNLATGDDPYREVFAAIRHNLGIWAIPFLIGGYWTELMTRLRDEKAKTEGILAAIGEGILIEGMDHRILYQNPAHEALFGKIAYSDCRDSLRQPGLCPLAAIPPSSAHGKSEEHLQTAAGPVDMEISSFPLLNGGGVQVAGISLVRDVSERKRMETALRESERRYRALVDNINLGITLVDDSYRIRMVNSFISRFFKADPTDVAGKPCHLFFENRLEVCAHCPGTRAMATGKPAETEVENAVPGLAEPQCVRIQAFPVLDENGEARGFIEVVENITELKRGRDERARLEERLLQNQKLESLGILAGGIAHDFNNLLMGIVGNVDLALAKSSPESPVRPYLQRIDTAAQRAADLTNQMLAYSGKGRFVVEPIDLSRLVEEMGHLLETVVNRNAILKYQLAPNLPLIEADATQLRQVVMNLITNASDAIGNRSGVISVTTGLVDADRAYLNTMHFDHELAEGYYVYLEVADTGCGMDKETREKIFDPFFTTKHTGRGLGLAAVLGIVRGHKGALKVYSESRRGTTFKIMFPISAHTRAEDDFAAISSIEKGAPAPRGPARTILVVDDDETVLSTAKMLLEEKGYRVLTADDGVEGVELFMSRANEISAVILDLTMPHMDGDEAFRRMRMIRPDVPVIMSSGYNEQDAVSRFAGKNIAGFIQKPYRLTTLIGKLREVLGG